MTEHHDGGARIERTANDLIRPTLKNPLAKTIRPLALITLSAVVLAGCDDDDDDDFLFEEPGLRGVFTLSNEVDSNEVIFFRRGDDGTLTQEASFPTDGTGTGASIIGSQHPLQITQDGEFLLAVSSQSDELSAFRITEQGLERTDVVGTRGQKPVSVTIRQDGLVFVLNVNGGEGGLTGFRLSESGDLIPIPGADRQLSNDPMALPPQVEFSPDGNVLVVTERFAEDIGRIATFTVSPEGLLGEPLVQVPPGMTPFGMMFREDGVLVVSEAFAQAPGNPIPGEGKTSSFRVSEAGVLEVVSPAVPAQGTVTCWVQISEDGRFAWVTNTGSNDITTYAIGADGALERLSLTPTGDGPVGMATGANGEFFYNLNAGDATIKAFRIDETDGSLSEFQTVTVPMPAFGMMGFDVGSRFAALDTDGDRLLSQEEFNAGFAGDEGDFARFDINADRVLTREEFNAGLDETIGFAGFAEFDTDLSGTLSQQEFEAGLLGDAQDFAEFDADADAQITEEEFDAGLESQGVGFAQLDSDADAAISKGEFDTAMASKFTTLDSDADDLVSQQEFDAALAGEGNFGLLDSDLDGFASRDEFGIALGNEFTGLDTDADSLLSEAEFDAGLDAEAGFMGFDDDLDGLLSEEEFSDGFDQTSFAGFDTDADGFLSREEFNAAGLDNRDDRLFGDLLGL